MEATLFSLYPVGWVQGSRKQATDDHWDQESTVIRLDESRFGSEALMGLDAFSHAIVIFYMHAQSFSEGWAAARHPHNNPAWPKVGIFAQRAKARPNPLGLTVCEILEVEGTTLRLKGLDAIYGTPVLDIKPWVSEFGPRGEVRQPDWMTELMREYW